MYRNSLLHLAVAVSLSAFACIVSAQFAPPTLEDLCKQNPTAARCTQPLPTPVPFPPHPPTLADLCKQNPTAARCQPAPQRVPVPTTSRPAKV